MWRRNPRGLTEEETPSINLNVPLNEFLKMQVYQISDTPYLWVRHPDDEKLGGNTT